MAKANSYRVREHSMFEGLTKLRAFIENLPETVTKISVTPSLGPAIEMPSSGQAGLVTADQINAHIASFEAQDAQRLVRFSITLQGENSNNRATIAYSHDDSLGASTIAFEHFERWQVFRTNRVLATLADSFDLIATESFAPSMLPGSERLALQSYSAIASSLEGATTRLLHGASEQARDNARLLLEETRRANYEIEERRRTQEKALDERRRQLEAEFARKDAEAQHDRAKKEEELFDRLSAFEKKAAEFETRDSRWVRRNLLAEIQKKIESSKETELSSKTRGKRTIVHVVCWLFMLTGAALAGFMLGTASSKTVEWYRVAGTSAGTLLFASTLVFYLRWTNSWFSQHSQIEFRNMKFSSDILRASWLAELVFEWETERKTEFPNELMRTLSRDLFTTASSQDAIHPADDLTRVLRSLRRIRLGRNVIDIEREPSSSQDSTNKSG